MTTADTCQDAGRITIPPPMFRALLALLVVLVAALLHGTLRPDLSVRIEMMTTTGAGGELFFAAGDDGYSQERSQAFPIVSDGQWHRYSVVVPSGPRMDRIRIDPGTGAGEVSVRSVELVFGGTHQQLRGSSLVSSLGITNHLQRTAIGSQRLEFGSEGVDPYLELKLPRPIGGASLLSRVGKFALIGLAIFGAWLLLEKLAGPVKRALAPSWMAVRLRKLAAVVSDEQVLRVTAPMLVTMGCLALVAMLYVVLRLNQSSIGLWETVYPDAEVEQMIDLGTPKRIRSDEWRVHTPWVLNQVLSGSPIHNPNVGGDLSPVFTALPVRGVIGLPQAKLAGFRLFGAEVGFSWWWAYKTFALIASFLWLCLLLTRGNLAASMLGSAWIYTTSFTQWWFSSLLPEIMIAFAVGMIGAIYALFSSGRGHIVAGCLLVVYAATNLVLHLYPPFIVPLAYLGVFILIGYVVQYRAIGLPRRLPWFRSAAMLGAFAVLCGYGIVFLAQVSDTIEAMRNTVYPGQRVSVSGGVPLAKLLYGFFEPIRLGEISFPLRPTNASEASSFVLLAPLALLVVPWSALVRRGSALLVALGLFCLVALAWIAFEVPAPLERLMQLAGWSLVTPKRAVLALGIGSIVACVMLFARVQEGRDPVRSGPARRMSVVAVGMTVLALGWGLSLIDPGFFTWKVIVIGTIASTFLAGGLALGRSALLATGIAMYALTTMTVNPLVSGISAISEKPVLLAAERVGGSAADKWVVIGDTNFAQGLKAHGLDVFAGSQFLPDRKSIAILDPDGSYEKVWNRYATIEVKSEPARTRPLFVARRGDQYAITVSVCSGMLQSLGITHIAYTGPVPGGDLACLAELPAPQDSGVRFFRYRPE